MSFFKWERRIIYWKKHTKGIGPGSEKTNSWTLMDKANSKTRKSLTMSRASCLRVAKTNNNVQSARSHDSGLQVYSPMQNKGINTGRDHLASWTRGVTGVCLQETRDSPQLLPMHASPYADSQNSIGTLLLYIYIPVPNLLVILQW